MVRRILTLAMFLATGVMSLVVLAGVEDRDRILTLEKPVVADMPFARVGCTMARHNGVLNGWTSTFEEGWGDYTYFDPAAECGSPTYPFEITGLWFVLFDPGTYTWPVNLDMVVYSVTNDIPCNGPGFELYRYPITADQATYGAPGGGTFHPPDPCCLSGPVFVGLEYTSGAYTSTPSLMYDSDMPVDTCMHWLRTPDGMVYEYLAYAGQYIGHPVYTVYGETMSRPCGAPCTWQPGDDYKMHFPQLPDETGWDMAIATQNMELADDWQCSETGWVTDIHFWGGWRNDIEYPIDSFVLRIYEDVPANPPNETYSHPGVKLWETTLGPDMFETSETITGIYEGWANVWGGRLTNSAQRYFQYNVCLPEQNWFYQNDGNIYWLSITPFLPTGVNTYEWGWKSTLDHFNDMAVYDPGEGTGWHPLWEPDEVLGNNYVLIVDATGNFVEGGASNAYNEAWYFYPESGWWNFWAYDHPYDPDRMKVFELMIQDLFPYDYGEPAYIEVALNWSTPQWSIDQPPGDSAPPLPGVDESLYIERRIVYQGDPREPVLENIFFDSLYAYNPEWVSVDVRGYNFAINGTLLHECRGQLDLSFVITGQPDEETQACCLPDGSCSDLLPTECTNSGGTPQGPGTTCATVTCEGVCDCIPGDANGDGQVNVGDAVYLISYVFKGGPGAVPYPICSGDANCDCTVNVGDAVYIISYVFKGGPAPCDCEEWVSYCGWPLRK